MTTTAEKTLTLEYVKTIGIVNNAPVGRGFANPVDLAAARGRAHLRAQPRRARVHAHRRHQHGRGLPVRILVARR